MGPLAGIRGSLWAATMPDDGLVRGEPLAADGDVDVAIVGAGFTGLWTAYHLAGAHPAVRIAVLEREHVGFGASGRNGGWCSALLATGLGRLAARHGRDGAIAMQRALQVTVDEVGDFAASAGTDFVKGGTISLARTPAQHARLAVEVDEARAFGFGADDLRWLTPDEATATCGATDVLGALFTPHCAAVHPLRLANALARACVERGVRLHDDTAVATVEPRRLTTTGGATVRADVVVLGTEAYTAQLDGRHRDLIPLYSLMIGSEPLSAPHWEAIGLDQRTTFHDARHAVIYGQRTADGRLAFGGRGAPYHFGSRIESSYDTAERVRAMLVDAVRDLFPVLADVEFPFHWGGPLGVPRDWRCAVRYDRAAGIATAGGYVGDGVATANLAGRTLADLITGCDSELVRLPWVDHRSPRWEPEPLRWLGVNIGRRAASAADAAEIGTTRAARWRAVAWSRLLDALTGR